ncbi:uncharacterized protein LOC117117957 isoform X2 [Anneissia japonica]|nr:uncharacterized protein LOC117117957 isoform X2 [Anneissia japonica]
MYSKIFVAAVVILCSFDVSNALMCYSCTNLDSDCGRTINKTMSSSIDQISCQVGCATIKIMSNETTTYNRTCSEEVDCPQQPGICMEREGMSCVECCNTTLCNDDFRPRPGPKPTDQTRNTTISAGSRGIANLVIVLLTLWLCTTLA